MLSSRPAEAERGLPHVVLADLFDRVVEEVLPTLSAPRRHALEAALLMGRRRSKGSNRGRSESRFARASSCSSRSGPVVLAVDDSQWVDPRRQVRWRSRCDGCATRAFLLVARRLGERAEAPGIEEGVEPHAVERLHVGPLSIGAMPLLLQQRLGRTFARPTLLRLHETSGGNPFYALELARGLASAGGASDPTEPLRVPKTLEQLVSARLAGSGTRRGRHCFSRPRTAGLRRCSL